MSKRLTALCTFLAGIAWPYLWEFIRSWIYEEIQHVMEPYIPSYDVVLHYGPAMVLVCFGLWLFCRAGRNRKTIGSPVLTLEPDSWSLRDLFGYLAPHLPLRAAKKTQSGEFVDGVDPRWKPIGDIVLKQLSLGKLHAIGRQLVHNTKRLHAATIPSEFWRDAKFTFWFLDAGPSNVLDASNSRDLYSQIEVNRNEAMAIWPNGAEISLLEAARQIYEHVKDAPIGIVIEGLNDGPDDILTWICDEIAMYRNGREPLVKLRGSRLPARTSEEIYTAPLSGYDFVVEGNAVVLQERHGKSRYENLTVTVAEVDRAIRELASRQV